MNSEEGSWTLTFCRARLRPQEGNAASRVLVSPRDSLKAAAGNAKEPRVSSHLLG